MASRWGPIFDQALVKFNELSDRNRLGVKLKKSGLQQDTDDTNIAFDFSGSRPKFTFRGVERTHADSDFDPVSISGLTLPLFQGGRLVKAFIFVPRFPLVVVPDREVGDGVKLSIAVHELIHAVSGLDNHDHSPSIFPDVFCGPPISIPNLASGGDDASRDRLELRSPNKTPTGFIPGVFTPPIFLSARTVGLIKESWAK
jgi:hypothetical protein